jgi:hypothetical protein
MLTIFFFLLNVSALKRFFHLDFSFLIRNHELFYVYGSWADKSFSLSTPPLEILENCVEIQKNYKAVLKRCQENDRGFVDITYAHMCFCSICG